MIFWEREIQILTNAGGTTVQLERLACIKGDKLLAFVENNRPIYNRFSVSVHRDDAQRDRPE